VFLDAREDAEFMVSHIRDAIHIGFNNFKPCCLSDLDRSANYIVYCSLGWRSGKICQLLKQHGFANIHNLYGGIFEWVNLGKEVVNDSIPVRRIHAYSKSWGLWVSCPGKVY
ncbi:MAG: rhodanese-like domain-containing protein, partial [Chitinophagaceae bacterium]